MLASNQPYQRVDDGIGAGVVGGAMIGGAITSGVVTGAMMKGIKSVGGGDLKAGIKSIGRESLRFDDRHMGLTGKQTGLAGSYRKQNRAIRAMTNSMEDGITKKFMTTAMGTGKRRAIAGGISMLGGALIGGAIDGANN